MAEPGAESLLAQFSLDLDKLSPVARRSAAPIEMREEDPEHFMAAVRGALAYTAAGDVYQTNLSRLWQGEGPVGAGDLYRRLRRANPSPFAAYLTFGEYRHPVLLAGAPGGGAGREESPPVLLRARGRAVQTGWRMKRWYEACSATKRSAPNTSC